VSSSDELSPDDIITDSYGIEVFTKRWNVSDPRGLVLVSHGASEHCLRYDRFARALNDAGFSVAALDHRGHGRTAASSGAGVMGPGGGESVISDLHELRESAVAEQAAGVPVFLFGHSMGSLIGLGYLTRHSAGLTGGVLCGFPADLENAAALGAMLAEAVAGGMGDAPFDGLAQNNAAFEPARTGFDWLSRDPVEVDRYVADPMCGDGNPITFGYLADLFGVVGPAADALGAISCPVLVIAGDQDPAAGMGAFASGLATALSAADVATDLTLYPGARHELLNETNRDDVTADIVSWLSGTTGS
jgi:alpha-beta hydrolase superfamily lysophospholipase